MSWILSSERKDEKQSAYQILCASSEEILYEDRGDLWDSGKVESDESIHISYEGGGLRSRQRVWWKVQVWDGDGEKSDWSDVSYWEMGLLDSADWKAQWIGSDLRGGKWTTIPCPFLRREFALKSPVAKARLYVTALGLVEVHLNGKRVGDTLFSPGWTDYRKRVQYDVYDVSDLIREGDNCVGSILGDGWYCGFLGNGGRQHYGDQPRMLLQLEVEYEDGNQELITSDEQWAFAFGPILESDFLKGESYDARLEFPGWDSAGFSEIDWRPVKLFADQGLKRVARRGPPVTKMEELKPKEISAVVIEGVVVKKHKLFDLGQNMVGFVRLKIKGEAGLTVQLRHSEILDEKGAPYYDNLRSADSIDSYTLKGTGEIEVFEPHFTFHGFRYVELIGFDGEVDEETITGVVVHSDTPQTGTFECSNELVNQLQKNIDWGQRGNFLEVPTDCPQRDERLGWTGDAQVFIRTASFNRDVASFFTKWQQDMADGQTESGGIPRLAPSVHIDKRESGGPAWADAVVICPWNLYLCYGDTRLLERHYDSMRGFITYLENSSREYIYAYEGSGWQGFGDWLSIEADTPKDLLGTAFFAYSTSLMGKIAKVLGRKEDEEYLSNLWGKIGEAFQKKYVSDEGQVASGTQTACVLALHFDLAKEKDRPAILDALVADIEKRGMQLSTGFVGCSYLPYALSNEGRLDVAYALLQQTKWPSWLYAVTQGATTIWERWDGWTHDKGFQNFEMNSFNHYAYGSIGEWLYSVVAGLNVDPECPGYKKIIIRPQPGKVMTYAKADYLSVRGLIKVSWVVKDGLFLLDVSIPANTEAEVWLPTDDVKSIREGGKEIENADGCVRIGSGSYSFQSTYLV
ncbi:MAG: glycoside hydrolase family 78 protein [Opitutaceae bacterium]|nr:glycoside hydrolase family 78 protein [Opitutaceae bacterium]